MKSYPRYGLVCILLFVLSVSLHCSRFGKKKGGYEPDKIYPAEIFFYEKGAIDLVLRGDPSLHLYQGQPHTLATCVYQLSNPNAFNQLKDEKQGISELMKCTRFDASVTKAKMLIVQPGETLKEVLDRAEGTRYVGIVAGYYTVEKDSSDRDQVIRLICIPIKDTIFSRPKVEKLMIDLCLGPHEIENHEEK